MEATDKSNKYGLIGYPLGHSFSQRFFRDKFKREGIDADYLNFEIKDVNQLNNIIDQHPTLRGLNCTIPHKQAIIPLLDELHPDAQAIGAVNTIRIDGSRLIGYNTDCIGFERSLLPLLRPCHAKALVLGTGGASKAIVHVLRRLGITPTYVSRRPANPPAPTNIPCSAASSVSSINYSALTPDIMATHTLIVNCSPVGMYPNIDSAPEIPYRTLTPDHLLYDLVYNPEITRFMALGRKQGATVKNGLEMLILQAEAAWEIWNGQYHTRIIN